MSFKTIAKYPNYEIDTSGNVRNWATGEDVLICKKADKNGLARVCLKINNKSKYVTISDLLGETFTLREIMGHADLYDNDDEEQWQSHLEERDCPLDDCENEEYN